MNIQTREIKTIVTGMPAMDGDGVKLTRIIGITKLNMLDPFLLLDSFESDQAQDYIGGFPDHPHRGFETVTYLLAGKMRHKDSAGHEGVIEAGGVQWMTAGRGIVHSEMPEQENGLLQGFQLWINLPAAEKMRSPAYQEFSSNSIATERTADGTEIRIIAGTTDKGTTGPVVNEFVKPTYMDVSIAKGKSFTQSIEASDNTFIYLIEGSLLIGNSQKKLEQGQLAVLQAGEQVKAVAEKDSRFLLLSAQPLNEPVARGGPFVMNTKTEVLQAFEDFQNDRF